MRALQRRIVSSLEAVCVFTHPIVHRRPFLWLPLPLCPLATLSDRPDRRWGTGVWQIPPAECVCCDQIIDYDEQVIVREGWEGRMDGYCHECSLRRCDVSPDDCPRYVWGGK